MAIFQQYPYSTLNYSAGWAIEAYTGSRTGNIIKATTLGQTISTTKQATDFYLTYVPAEVYDAEIQVNVDGVNTKIINLKGSKNDNVLGVAQEKITITPLALGLSDANHTIILTTLGNVTCKIDSIETKTGTMTLDGTKFLASGDSITDMGDSGTGWVTQLCSYLGKTMADIGEGSSTVDQGMVHYWDYVKGLSSVPSQMSIMFGVNDILWDANYDLVFVERRFKEFVDLVWSLNAGIQITLGQVPYIGGSFIANDTYAEQWNAKLLKVAQDKGLKFAYSHTAYHANSYTLDGIHPNATGEQLLFAKFRDAESFTVTAEEPMYFGAPFDAITYDTITLDRTASTQAIPPPSASTGKAYAPTASKGIIAPAATSSGQAYAPKVITPVQVPVATSTGRAFVPVPVGVVKIPVATSSGQAVAPKTIRILAVPVPTSTGRAIVPIATLQVKVIPAATSSGQAIPPRLVMTVKPPAAVSVGRAYVPSAVPKKHKGLDIALTELPERYKWTELPPRFSMKGEEAVYTFILGDEKEVSTLIRAFDPKTGAELMLGVDFEITSVTYTFDGSGELNASLDGGRVFALLKPTKVGHNLPCLFKAKCTPTDPAMNVETVQEPVFVNVRMVS